jgi:UDP-N-acetylmuramoyl-L-alanyl-D-glutamate--2,6-diaminopimelate ligase
MKYLDELIDPTDFISSSGDLHVPVTGVYLDSRKMKPGGCFVAIRGFRENGLMYLGDALASGTGSIIFETRPDDSLPEIPITLSWVLVKSARKVLSKMAARFYGNVSDSMYVAGVTGTNGKTTVTNLIHDIFNQQEPTAKIGTLGMSFRDTFQKTSLTTPEAVDIFRFLSQINKEGCQNLVMETSSVGLKLRRVDDIHFSQAIFTNFSGDHLDIHMTMEDYFDSKLMLFKRLKRDDWAVINLDDPIASKILDEIDAKYLTYGFSEDADVHPEKYKFNLKGIQATIRTPKGPIAVQCPLIGRVNLLNILAAVTSAVIKGIPFDTIAAAIAAFKPVKGRLDTIYHNGFSVMIDYAHTDNALESMLKSMRELTPGRIILVFGAGGSRDNSKRPRMGEVASKHADFLVITSDNPRSEKPMDIINDIKKGLVSGFDYMHIEPDRKKAIQTAINMAQKGDLVIIAGKGHEDYQILMDKTVHFDDYEVARDVLNKLK